MRDEENEREAFIDFVDEIRSAKTVVDAREIVSQAVAEGHSLPELEQAVNADLGSMFDPEDRV